MHSSSRLFHGLDNGRYHDGDGEPFLRGSADWSNPTPVQKFKIIERFARWNQNWNLYLGCLQDSRPIQLYIYTFLWEILSLLYLGDQSNLFPRRLRNEILAKVWKWKQTLVEIGQSCGWGGKLANHLPTFKPNFSGVTSGFRPQRIVANFF